MSYKVTINGKSYELPARTFSVDEHIETVSELDEKYQKGEVSRRHCVTQMHEFIEHFAPGAFPSIDDADTNDIIKACIDIISVYSAPEIKARTESKLSSALDILKKQEVKTAIDLVNATK